MQKKKDIIEYSEILKAPEPGMYFSSFDDLYRQYGKQEGKSKSHKKNYLNPNPLTKVECKARINGTILEHGKCKINSVILEHNHGLSPQKSRFYLCNREISISAQRKLELNDRAGISVAKNFQSFVIEARGHDTVPFLQKDCRNLIEKARRLRLGVGDAEATWLACMSGCAPNAIITDQDKAMKKAIEIVFPQSRHRWCLWHIMKKMPEKLSGYQSYKPIKKALKKCVYNSLTKEEFEKTWGLFISDFNLQDNGWLNSLYEERCRWVPAFVKDTFWAGMSTTQRSESMNAFFDGYVNSKTTLKQFVEQYDSALRDKIEKENQADFQSFSTLIPCVTHFAIEKQFQAAYTNAKFTKFQKELIGKIYCEVSCVDESFGLFDVCEVLFFDEGSKEVHLMVHFNKENNEVQCSCWLFEFKGILCKHTISILIRMGVSNVPMTYILS
ncbi:protein FAR-RED IMPAIRED RESPONSE 1-like [Humulus lupulus]|uniref:protein FAR-RED IMPAIRED RESPONSE 1-like n=1 Tax=Humulus lupulus TaxID=3486 RepID=UPI002B403659|nr:protein FAR-RED IMPAIRED RESPONSE 1-like [Humulus lupulus]